MAQLPGFASGGEVPSDTAPHWTGGTDKVWEYLNCAPDDRRSDWRRRPWYAQLVIGGEWYCFLCNKYATIPHLEERRHKRNLEWALKIGEEAWIRDNKDYIWTRHKYDDWTSRTFGGKMSSDYRNQVRHRIRLLCIFVDARLFHIITMRAWSH